MSSWNEDRFFRNLQIILFLFFLYGAAMGFLIGRNNLVASLLGFLFTGIFIFSMLRLVTSGFNHLKGLIGESRVEVVLEEMYSNHVRRFPNIKLGHGDIDYVVINKYGVWTVESKYIEAKIFVEDDLINLQKNVRKDFIKQVNNQYFDVRKFLTQRGYRSTPVRSILVFTHPRASIQLGLKLISENYVIGLTWLRNVIENPEFCPALTVDEIEELSEKFKELSRKNEDI